MRGIGGISSPQEAAGYGSHPLSGPGRLFDIGGRRLHAVITGEGPATVLLEAGGFAWSTDWEGVTEALGPGVRTVAYDRAGLGWSDAGPSPRDLAHHVEDLEKLVGAADLAPPYVVAGASYGGHIARAFTAARPEQVRGLVLVDSRHPEMTARMPAAWARLERNAMAATRVMGWLARTRILPLLGPLFGERNLPPAARKLPADRRATYLRDCFGPRAWQTSLDEAAVIGASDAQAARLPGHGDLPMIVLTHDMPDLFAGLGPEAPEAERVWQSLQAALGDLSSKSKLRVVSGAGHAISHDRPDAVADAIRSLLP